MATAIVSHADYDIDIHTVELRSLSTEGMAAIARQIRLSEADHAGHALVDAIIDEGTRGRLYSTTLKQADKPKLVGEIVTLTLLGEAFHNAHEIAKLLSPMRRELSFR